MSAGTDGPAVLVTRPAEDAARWVDALARRGRRAIVFPCLRIEPLGGPDVAAALRAAVAEAAVLALTSPRAARRAAELLGAPLPARLRVAVVGRATAEAAREAFGRADIVPASEHGEALARRLAEDTTLRAGDKVAWPCADRARGHLEQRLGPRGVVVERVPVYRTVPAPPQEPKDDPAALGAGAALLASPSAVTGLANRARGVERLLLVSIGPATSAAIRGRGWVVAAEARRPGLDEMIAALERAEAADRSGGVQEGRSTR